MWTTFSHEGKQYMFFVDYDKESLNVKLTDLCNAWSETLKSDEIVCRFEALNPSKSPMCNDVLADKFTKDLNPGSECVSTCIEVQNTSCSVKISNKVSLISFCFNLSAISCEDFSKDITLPLILIVGELRERLNKLQQLVTEKDDEITEYKLEKAKLVRSYLETKKFNDEEFLHECCESTEKNVTRSLDNLSQVIDEDFNFIYKKAVRASHNYVEEKRQASSLQIDKPESTSKSDKINHSKQLKWEIGPQNVKRIKTNHKKIKI